MYAGRIVELADADRFFGEPGPGHPYARGLLDALPERAFAPVPGMPPELGALPDGCAFAARCSRADDRCSVPPRSTAVWPATTVCGQARRSPPMLELARITAGYDPRDPVVRDASLTIAPGESVGLLGPSGCGKSTLAKVAALLHRPDAGTVVLDGRSVRGWRHRAPRAQRTAVGVVFQQPRLSADPRLSLRELMAQPLRATGRMRGGDGPGGRAGTGRRSHGRTAEPASPRGERRPVAARLSGQGAGPAAALADL